MADLMTQTAEYEKLAADYGNFMVPLAKVVVNGTDIISSMHLYLAELSVTLSTKAAGCAVIKIAGQYDNENHSFSGNLKDKLKLGTVVEVELGYLDKSTKVFKGYVAMVGAEMGEEALFVATLMDARRLMMTSGVKHLFYEEKNYSDAFGTVMKPYGDLCTVKVDATSDNLEMPISQNCTDYEFVTGELIKRGTTQREFFIVADKAYFREIHSNETPIMSMEYGRELLSFEVNHNYMDLEIEVVGYNSKDHSVVSSKKKIISAIDKKTVLSGGATSTQIEPNIDTVDKATKRGETMASYAFEQICTGEGVSIGLPEIVPGRYVEVENLDAIFNKKFYITEVTHRLFGELFTTTFEIGGCKS